MNPNVRKLIRALHGSPYDFDKFDASKIGTGEGAASHGLGFYLTNSSDLAEYYRPKGGLVYEVEVPRRQEELLDWNTPIIQQPQHIQDAVRELLDRDATYLKGGKAYDQIAKYYGEGRASDLLFERGIAGNTFVGAKQGDGARARNYVMFPGSEDFIRILRKYGIMAPVAAAAGGVATASEGTGESKMNSSAPVLSGEELERVRQHFAGRQLNARQQAYFDQLEQAGSFVDDGIEAEGIEFSQGGQPSGIESSMSEQDLADATTAFYGERPDWNTGDSRARQRLENYYSAVTDAMQQPVISVRAATDMTFDLLAGQFGLEDNAASGARQALEQRIAAEHPDGFMSPSDLLRHIQVQPWYVTVEAIRASGQEVPEEIVAGQAAALERLAAEQSQGVADYIGKKTYDPDLEAAVGLVRQAVSAHAPKGPYASYASRTAEENAQAANDPLIEDPNYRLTEDGAQNHRAMRVAELFSASDEGYAPATGLSQFARAVGGTMGPLINRVRGVSDSIDRRNAEGTAFDDMREIGSTYGKFGYAANLYNAAGQGDPQDAYAPDGTAKYYGYDPTNQMGLAQSMYNTSFPMARMYNNTAPVREAALHMGEFLAGRDPAETAQRLRELRRENRAITPTVPDGVDPEQHRALGEKLENADTGMSGMMSATWGPKYIDAANAVFGTNAPRTYLSPAADTLLQVPAESLSDPINMGFNIALPGAAGMIAGGTRGAVVGGLPNVVRNAGMGLLSGLKTAPMRMGDDVVEEMAENNLLGPTTMGFGGFFAPEKDNLLMRGYQGDPNTPGFDAEVERRHLQAREDQMNVADAYGQMRDEGAKKKADERYRALGPQTRPVASVRFGDEQPTEAGNTLQGLLSGPQSREEAEYEEWRKSQGQPPSQQRKRSPVAEVRW